MLSCHDSDTVSGAVNVEVLEPLLIVSNDTAICFSDTIQIAATGAITYSWTPNVNISNVNVGNPEVWPSVTTTYFIESVDASGCESVDSVIITVQSLPIADNFVRNVVCSLNFIG